MANIGTLNRRHFGRARKRGRTALCSMPLARLVRAQPVFTSWVNQAIEYAWIAWNDWDSNRQDVGRVGHGEPVSAEASVVGLRHQPPARVVRGPGERQAVAGLAGGQRGRVGVDGHDAQSAVYSQLGGIPQQARRGDEGRDRHGTRGVIGGVKEFEDRAIGDDLGSEVRDLQCAPIVDHCVQATNVVVGFEVEIHFQPGPATGV